MLDHDPGLADLAVLLEDPGEPCVPLRSSALMRAATLGFWINGISSVFQNL